MGLFKCVFWVLDIVLKYNLDDIWQTLFFNHRSLDLTLSDWSKSQPTVSPDKPMGQLWAASSSVFEAQSLTNSAKS